LKFPLNPT